MVWLLVGVLILLLGSLVGIVLIVTKKRKVAKIEESKKIHTTQEQLPFEYIRRGVVKLKNGQYIKLMQVPCINTQLMEEEEKEVIREIYASLLNSLDFKIQLYKQSRLVDVNDYLAFLKEKESAAENKFKELGIREYAKFVAELIKENSVQTKKDFLVVSWAEATTNKRMTSEDEMKKYRKSDNDTVVSEEEAVLKEERMFEKAFKILTQREKTLQKQLRRFGISPTFLGDKEIFELFYIAYNRERSVHQTLKGVNPKNYTSLYVKKV